MRVICGFILTLIAASAPLGAPAIPSRPTPAPPAAAVEVDMRNVDLLMAEDVTLRVHSLRGRFVPTRPGGVPNLDDSGSYVVEVEAGETAIGQASLNALVNEHVFGHMARPPVKDLDIRVGEGRVEQKGKLDKKIDIPFDVKGAVEATPDGRIRIHAKSIRSLGLPVKPLMRLFGIEMDELMKVEPGHGLVVDDNDLIIDPTQMLPPPRLRGRVTAVRIVGSEIVQTFGSGRPAPLRPPAASPNHIYWRGGTLRFGKLTMRDTDLELIDQNPSDPFAFSVAGYDAMLVAGYSKNTARKGLKTYMPDFDDLRAGRRVAHSP